MGPVKQGRSSYLKLPKNRSETILIVLKDEKAFVDVIRTLCTVEDPDNRLEMRGVTKTKDGAALTRIKGNKWTSEELTAKL